jgi:hypothetical protein
VCRSRARAGFGAFLLFLLVLLVILPALRISKMTSLDRKCAFLLLKQLSISIPPPQYSDSMIYTTVQGIIGPVKYGFDKTREIESKEAIPLPSSL